MTVVTWNALGIQTALWLVTSHCHWGDGRGKEHKQTREKVVNTDRTHTTWTWFTSLPLDFSRSEAVHKSSQVTTGCLARLFRASLAADKTPDRAPRAPCSQAPGRTP